MADRWDSLADDMVGGYQERFVADLTARFVDMLEQGVSNPDMLAQLVRQSRTEAMGVWASWSGKVTDQARDAFYEALAEADDEIVGSLAGSHAPRVGVDQTVWAQNRMREAARGMAEIVRRQNVALGDTFADLWYDVTAEAVTYTQGGASRDEVMHRAVERLADEGLQTIDYSSGVRTAIDAAVRRHVVTQSNQCRNDVLMRRCDEYGVDLVMVSAHYGARPTHAVWQGGVYSRSGSSSRYRGLVEATGYGSVTGLCGANCRHTMTPYVEGLSKPQSTDFSAQEAVTGLTSDEYYEATQKQRAIERRIRAEKRDIALLERERLDATEHRLKLGKLQAQMRRLVADNHLTRDLSRERAYGVERQPVALRRARAAAAPTSRDVKIQRRIMAVVGDDERAWAKAESLGPIKRGGAFDVFGHEGLALINRDLSHARVPEAAELFARHQGEFAYGGKPDPKLGHDAYHDPRDNKVYFDVSYALDGDKIHSARATIYHEYAHMLDYTLGGGRYLSVTAKGPNGVRFGDAIRRDCDNALEKIRTDRAARRDGHFERLLESPELRRGGDSAKLRAIVGDMVADGSISEYYSDMVRDRIDDIVSGAREDGSMRRLLRKVADSDEMTEAEAISFLEKAVHSSGNMRVYGNVDDVFEGAFYENGAFRYDAKVGHKDATYRSTGTSLEIETFAELFDASMKEDGRTWSMMCEYFPTTVETWRGIVNGLLERR